MDDDDLEDYLADIEDVVNGRVASMEHAKVMYDMVDAIGDLSDSLDWIVCHDTELRAAVNKRSVEELARMVETIRRMQAQIDKYFDIDRDCAD